MKRYILSALAPLAAAGIGDNIYNERDPVEWVSLDEDDQNDFRYNLRGNYGSKRMLGNELIYINFEVGGANIPDGDYVLTWASIPDLENPGLIHGVICRAQYQSLEVEMIERDILIETYDDYSGTLDFTRVQGHPDSWYPES